MNAVTMDDLEKPPSQKEMEERERLALENDSIVSRRKKKKKKDEKAKERKRQEKIEKAARAVTWQAPITGLLSPGRSPSLPTGSKPHITALRKSGGVQPFGNVQSWPHGLYCCRRRGSGRRRRSARPSRRRQLYKYSIGQPFIYPDNNLDYASNFLRMCFATPTEEYKVNPILAKAMDRIFTLHADHEQNASTSTVRLAGSSGANPFACIAAGIACLWGPAHGGANEACLNMLREIGTVDRIPEFIARAKDKSDPFRLMGFGHRVYKNFDPRATVMKESADEVLELMGIENNETLLVAKALEKIALEDPYFIDKKLYPNVDFYSGIILDAMGFPTSMFTPIFAMSRTVGWIAQWKEMIADPKLKIGRPRQLYTGATKRDYINPNDR